MGIIGAMCVSLTSVLNVLPSALSARLPCPGQWRKEADDLLQSAELKAVYEENFAASDRGMKYPGYYTVRRWPRNRRTMVYMRVEGHGCAFGAGWCRCPSTPTARAT